MNAHPSKTSPRKQRADRLGLLILWAEAGTELRRVFGGSFARFESYAAREAERLIRSAANSGETVERVWRGKGR